MGLPSGASCDCALPLRSFDLSTVCAVPNSVTRFGPTHRRDLNRSLHRSMKPSAVAAEVDAPPQLRHARSMPTQGATAVAGGQARRAPASSKSLSLGTEWIDGVRALGRNQPHLNEYVPVVVAVNQT